MKLIENNFQSMIYLQELSCSVWVKYLKKKSSNSEKVLTLCKPFEPNYKGKFLYDIEISARLFLYLDHGAICKCFKEFLKCTLLF